MGEHDLVKRGNLLKPETKSETSIELFYSSPFPGLFVLLQVRAFQEKMAMFFDVPVTPQYFLGSSLFQKYFFGSHFRYGQAKKTSVLFSTCSYLKNKYWLKLFQGKNIFLLSLTK